MCSHFNINQVQKNKNKMKTIIKYIKNMKNTEKKSIKIIKNTKNTKIILQKNIEILFFYKKKLCKEKICKITIKKTNNY